MYKKTYFVVHLYKGCSRELFIKNKLKNYSKRYFFKKSKEERLIKKEKRST